METYGVITPGEEVFDHDMQGGEEDDDDNIEFPDEVKVNHSGDIKDEQCFIVYKKNLLQLVTFLLHLPEEMKCREPECTSTVRLGPDPVTKSVGSGMVLKWVGHTFCQSMNNLLFMFNCYVSLVLLHLHYFFPLLES